MVRMFSVDGSQLNFVRWLLPSIIHPRDSDTYLLELIVVGNYLLVLIRGLVLEFGKVCIVVVT